MKIIHSLPVLFAAYLSCSCGLRSTGAEADGTSTNDRTDGAASIVEDPTPIIADDTSDGTSTSGDSVDGVDLTDNAGMQSSSDDTVDTDGSDEITGATFESSPEDDTASTDTTEAVGLDTSSEDDTGNTFGEEPIDCSTVALPPENPIDDPYECVMEGTRCFGIAAYLCSSREFCQMIYTANPDSASGVSAYRRCAECTTSTLCPDEKPYCDLAQYRCISASQLPSFPA